MAHLWSPSIAGLWQPHLLNSCAVALSATAPHVRTWAAKSSAFEGAVVLLWRTHDASGDAWTLLAGPGARVVVNGLAVDHGIAALADRDEIRVPSTPPLFFSTEHLAAVVPFPGESTRGFCPRCKQAIPAGDPAVKCPGCGLWHHGSETLPCWTYAECCAACPQPTRLDAGLRWTPEEV